VPSSLPQPRSVYINELKAFLGHGDQRVLLLHGHWGTGKTYFWNNFARTQREYLENKFYSYVSLFGASSVADVKALIVLGGQPRSESNKIGIRWQRIKNWFFRKQRYFDQLKVPYFGSIGALVPKAEELLIEDFLVCFDDLERRNRKLDLEQVFGLIAVLKEQNRCRVVIICNEEELSPRDRRTLNKYREKIVDRQLTYNPRFDENFRVIFSTTETAIRELFERLGLNNIRVFQQTWWCIRYFESLLKGCHDIFVQRFHQQCAKLAAVHFACSRDITFDDIRSTSWMLAGWRERAGVPDPTTELVVSLQFTPSDADDFIIGYLRDGYCNLSALKPIIERLNREHKRTEAQVALERLWDDIWQTYRVDAQQITAEAEKLLEQYHTYLPFKQINDLLEFVRKINPSFNSQPLREMAARGLLPNADVATLRAIQAVSNDPDIVNAAKEKETQLRPRQKIGELIEALGASDGWNPSDFALLNDYCEDELFEWTLSTDQDNVLYAIAETIARGQLESADNKSGKEVGVKFRKVFERLAQRSTLDAERTTYVFERIRRKMKQYGREAPPEICPLSSVDAKQA
jgi:hypothetical protein